MINLAMRDQPRASYLCWRGPGFFLLCYQSGKFSRFVCKSEIPNQIYGSVQAANPRSEGSLLSSDVRADLAEYRPRSCLL